MLPTAAAYLTPGTTFEPLHTFALHEARARPFRAIDPAACHVRLNDPIRAHFWIGEDCSGRRKGGLKRVVR